jgi:hypothetical protein
MDQGFWLFFIFQLVALGTLSERMNLVGLRRYALLAGVACSLAAAFLILLLTTGAVGTDAVRTILKWMALIGMTGSLVATAGSVVLPAEIVKKKS